MTLVTATVEDVHGSPDNSVWIFHSLLREASDGSGIVTPKPVRVTPVAGVLSINLDPGYSAVAFRGKEYTIEIPASGSVDLWDLIAASIAFPPGTPPTLVAQAVMGYLATHPLTSANLSDSGATGRAVFASNTQLAGRAALGLGVLGKPVVTPEDFGAVGGGADDAVPLRNMFLSAVTNGGANILIPNGKVYCSSLPMDMKSNTFVTGSGTLKCTAFHSAGMFIQYKNAVKNVTWIGPTVDINGIENMNGHAIGDVPNTTDFVSDIHIEGKVVGTRIDKGLELVNTYFGGATVLYAGGGKGLTVQFRARNVYCNIIAEDCDIACSIEAAVSESRYLENVVIDVQSKNSHRTALFIGGSRDGISSLDSGSYMHSLYPGVKIRLRAQGGQDGLIPNTATGLIDGNNWDNAGVVTLNYASGVDLEIYAATESRCTLIRGMAAASTIRVTNALMDDLQDVWDTRPIDTLTPAGSVMADNVFEANVHAKTHNGVVVRPHRDSAAARTMVKSILDVNMWCQNGVGAITQSDGTTDEFGTSVAYQFRDMKSSPIKEIVGISSHNPGPQWANAAPGGGIAFAANLKADNLILTSRSTVTAAGTTTLTIADKQTQVFTGSAAQTVLLPTTSVLAGQTYTLINDSSGALTVQSANTSAIITQFPGKIMVYEALIDTPLLSTDWQIVGMGASSSASTQTLAMRDTNGNIAADNFIATATSTPTAAGTTTLTINSAQTQVFTGSTTQTVLLPTALAVAGQPYTIVNNSSGIVTVQSSGANTVASVPPGTLLIFVSRATTPTTAAHWQAIGDPASVATLSNKTIDLGSNTVTMTAAQLNAAVSDADIAHTTGPFPADQLSAGFTTLPRWAVTSVTQALATGIMQLTYFTADKTQSVSGITVRTGGTAAAATPTLCRIGLFSVAANGDITLIASTVNDTALFAASATSYAKSFAVPASVTLGDHLAVGILVVSGAALPTMAGSGAAASTGSAEMAIAPRLSGQVTGLSDLPSSTVSASVANSSASIYSRVA